MPCRTRPLKKQIATRPKTKSGAEDAADRRLDRAGVEAERAEAEQDQHIAGRGDHGRVDRAAPLLGPVDVVEVDPERELVDRQPGADAEDEGADLGVGAVAEGGEAERAGDHHRHDPEDEVVEVDAAVADHAARPPGHLGAAHQPRAHADEGEGEDEADEDQEDALLFVGEDLLVPEVGEDRGGESCGHRRRLECELRALAVLGGDQVEGEQHGGDREERGERTMLETDSASHWRGSESPSRLVDEAGDGVGERVADDLDRDQDREDEPEVAADQPASCGRRRRDTVVLDLDHRRRRGRSRRRRGRPGTTKTSRPTATRARR